MDISWAYYSFVGNSMNISPETGHAKYKTALDLTLVTIKPGWPA
jgi:hypothetical protein